MITVGSYEARTHLSQLLDRVAKGERVTITRHGVPVAVLEPVGEREKRERVREAIRRIKELRKGKTTGGMSIREMIEEGRRY